MSIFRSKPDEAPEVEVRDGEIVIAKRDDGGEGEETRKVKLPKTKWA